MTRFRRITAITLAASLICLPAAADEVEDALKMALEAYQAGDIATAKEEIDFAAQLITQMKAAGLSGFLPEPLDGWSREEAPAGGGVMMGFGGGLMANARYVRDSDDVSIEIMAENQMVTAMAAMFGNTAMMGSMGQVKRIGRQKVVITNEGELQALVDNRIFIRVSGSAPIEDKEAYFAAIDLKGLEDF